MQDWSINYFKKEIKCRLVTFAKSATSALKYKTKSHLEKCDDFNTSCNVFNTKKHKWRVRKCHLVLKNTTNALGFKLHSC